MHVLAAMQVTGKAGDMQMPERQARRRVQHGRRRGRQLRQHPRTVAELNCREPVRDSASMPTLTLPASGGGTDSPRSPPRLQGRTGWGNQRAGDRMARSARWSCTRRAARSCRASKASTSRLPPGDVTVAVEYSTLNYKDGMILQGQGRLVRQYPHVPGIDFAGTVEASVDPRVQARRSGDPDRLAGRRVALGRLCREGAGQGRLAGAPSRGAQRRSRRWRSAPPGSPRCWR